MESQKDYKRACGPQQPIAAETGVDSRLPPRDPSDRDMEAAEYEPISTDWWEQGGFRVRLVLHPGPPSPERKSFFRDIATRVDGIST